MAILYDLQAHRATRLFYTLSDASFDVASEVDIFSHRMSQLEDCVHEMEGVLHQTGSILSDMRARMNTSLDDCHRVNAAVDSGDIGRMRQTLVQLQK